MINPRQILVSEWASIENLNYVSNAARAHEKNRWAYNFEVEGALRLEVEQCDYTPDFLFVSS